MCMMGDPGSRNLGHLMPEVRAQRGADFDGGKEDEGDDNEEEGGNRGDRKSVAFPRVTDEQEVTDAPKQETGRLWWLLSVRLLLSTVLEIRCAAFKSPQSTHCLLTHIPRLSSHLPQHLNTMFGFSSSSSVQLIFSHCLFPSVGVSQ